VQLVPLEKLGKADIVSIIKRAKEKFSLSIKDDFIPVVAEYCDGDARIALNLLEIISSKLSEEDRNDLKKIKELISESGRSYDRTDNRHYDVISAFIKSLRGSDPDAAIIWLAVMLDGGEDPEFIARRLVIFAAEDVGNADPMGITVATSTLLAVQNIGMPEARINLAQAVTYLASTSKSNASYMAISKATEYVQNQTTVEVPMHLRNNTPECKANYKYPHDYPAHYVKQSYTIGETPKLYNPTNNGFEKKLRERLEQLKQM